MKKRHNVDKIANSHSQNLINLCIASRMRILNGRTPGDFVGRLTCYNQQGASSADYILSHDSFIQNIVCTNVKQTDSTLKKLIQHSMPVGIVVKCDFQITEYASSRHTHFQKNKTYTGKQRYISIIFIIVRLTK